MPKLDVDNLIIGNGKGKRIGMRLFLISIIKIAETGGYHV